MDYRLKKLEILRGLDKFKAVNRENAHNFDLDYMIEELDFKGREIARTDYLKSKDKTNLLKEVNKYRSKVEGYSKDRLYGKGQMGGIEWREIVAQLFVTGSASLLAFLLGAKLNSGVRENRETVGMDDLENILKSGALKYLEKIE